MKSNMIVLCIPRRVITFVILCLAVSSVTTTATINNADDKNNVVVAFETSPKEQDSAVITSIKNYLPIIITNQDHVIENFEDLEEDQQTNGNEVLKISTANAINMDKDSLDGTKHKKNDFTNINTNTNIPMKQIGIDVHNKPVLIPLIGAGTWQYNDTIAYESLCKAFSVGITFVDTAFGYRNQYGVGKAIIDCFYNNNNSYIPNDYDRHHDYHSLRHYNTTSSNIKKQPSSSRVERHLKRNRVERHTFEKYVSKQEQEQQTQQRTRDDLFVLTKVPGGLSISETLATHEYNLKQLQLDYVDHLMVHFPSDWDITPSKSNKYVRQDQWRALEELYYQGKARSIGVSHYCQQHINDILEINTIPISINQVEYHIGSQDIDHIINHCNEHNITFMSFSPLCGPCDIKDPMNDSLINGKLVTDIGKKYNVTGSQVSLRFIIQQALNINSVMGPVIPKSNNIDHITSNMNIFDFELRNDDMNTLLIATQPEAESGDCAVP